MFKFRLQRVLELREKKEQARALELSQAEAEAGSAREKRDALAELRNSSRREISAAQDGESKVGHLHHMGFVLASLEQRLEQASEVVTSAEDVVKDRLTSLEDAARERRVLDRLKDKHSDAYRHDEAARDRLFMDEIALSRFGRSGGEGAGKDHSKARNSAHNSSNSADDNHSASHGGNTES